MMRITFDKFNVDNVQQYIKDVNNSGGSVSYTTGIGCDTTMYINTNSTKEFINNFTHIYH